MNKEEDEEEFTLDSILSSVLSNASFELQTKVHAIQSVLGSTPTVRSLLSHTKDEIQSKSSLRKEDIIKIYQMACQRTLYPREPVSVSNIILEDKDDVGTTLHTERLSFGNKILDKCFDGGLLCGAITEISGEAGSGKTQMCMQLLLSAQLPKNKGGLDAPSLYISTEVALPTERLKDMLKSPIFSKYFKNEREAFDNILTRSVESLEGLYSSLEVLSSLVPSRGVRLIVIDSIAAVLRADYGRDKSKERACILLGIANYLRHLAGEMGIVIVVVNQVTDYFEPTTNMTSSILTSSHNTRRVIPTLGLTWDNCINCRIMLAKTKRLFKGEVSEEEEEEEEGSTDYSSSNNTRGKRRRVSIKYIEDTPLREIRIIFSPHLPRTTCYFIIQKTGIYGV